MRSVAIVAMGTSNQEWLRRVYRGDTPEFFERVINERFASVGVQFTQQEAGLLQQIASSAGRRALVNEVGPPFDQVWAINHMGKLLKNVDLIVAMDDLRRESARYDSMLTGDVPVLTSKAYPEFNCIEYPIREVVEFLHTSHTERCTAKIFDMLDQTTARIPKHVREQIMEWAQNDTHRSFIGTYIRNSVTAAVVFAAFLGFERISLFGADFYYDDNNARSEEARANCEFWMGFCHALGIKLEVARGSTTLDMNKPQKIYGYAEQPSLPFDANREYVPDGNGWKITGSPKASEE